MSLQLVFLVLCLSICFSGFTFANNNTSSNTTEHFLINKEFLEFLLEGDFKDPKHSFLAKLTLQRLIDSSVQKDKIEQRNTRIAFFKTHKTGSTTMRSVIHRFAARRGMSVWDNFNFYTNYLLSTPSDNCRADMAYNHFSMNPWSYHGTLDNSDDFYNRVLKINGNLTKLTIVREPISQAISSFNYYRKGNLNDLRLCFIQFKKDCVGTSANSFGIKNENDLNNFIEKSEIYFDLIIVLEYFYESLVVLRRLLNCEMIDLVPYLQIWSRKNFKIQGDIEVMRPENKDVLHKLKEKTSKDAIIHEHAVKRLENSIKQLNITHSEMDEETNFLHQLVGIIQKICEVEENSNVCIWHKGFGAFGYFDTTWHESCSKKNTYFHPIPWIT